MTETNVPTNSPAEASIRFLFRELTDRQRDEQDIARAVGVHASEIGASSKELSSAVLGSGGSEALAEQALEAFFTAEA